MSKQSPKLLSLSALAAVSVLGLVLVAPGCGGGEAADDTCHDYSSFNGMSPTVGFSADVLPIFRNSCGLSTACHSQESGPVGQPFLGPPTIDGMVTAAQLMAIQTQNVGVTSTKAGTMKIVDPGKPESSFLMHKMDGTLKCADVTCESGCGSMMPLGAAMPLAADQRDIVRRWIAQGAKND